MKITKTEGQWWNVDEWSPTKRAIFGILIFVVSPLAMCGFLYWAYTKVGWIPFAIVAGSVIAFGLGCSAKEYFWPRPRNFSHSKKDEK